MEWTQAQLSQLEQLAGLGMPLRKIASVMNIPHLLLEDEAQWEPKVSEAIERGEALAEALVSRAVLAKAQKGDMQAAKWWEQTRSGRSETLKISEGSVDTASVPLTDAEIAQFREKFNAHF